MKEQKKTLHMAGKLITLIQLILAVGLIAVIWNSGLVPTKYLVAIIIVLLILFGVTFGLQYVKNKVYIVGIVLSIILSILQAIGIVYMLKADKLMADVGGANYKTDNMIVVVKKDNPASNLMDASMYRFGTQTAVDQENTQTMLDNINKALGREVKVEQYGTVQELANALLEGRVDAAIYNQALDGLITDSIEDYSDKVRVLYHYGIETELEQETADVGEPFNVYISGIDVDGPIATNSRSDVNIIMTVNPNTKKILLTTTPRDYYVQIPDISGEQRDKLTHAGIYGVDASMRTLEQLYGIDISYYARVNFSSLVKIVDTLGGVDVDSDFEFTAGGYQFKKGMNHLDGKQALAFSRERYSFEDGDNQRGKDQQKVLTAILNKAMSPAILSNASALIADVSDSVQTNMTQEEMAKFIKMQLNDGASWTIESQAASGNGDTQACYSSGDQPLYVMWPDEAVVQSISAKMNEILNGN
ncbi:MULTISPECIES: LCP family protein [Clostridia]|uniref:LCP family protein n=1 Tax=Clostridia TaxID=186801 RepID=UPI00242B0379|nr:MULTISPECIES: LCP family protein [Clostridia]